MNGESVDSLPRELYLEVTNRCNLRCRTCPQHYGMPEPFADLSVEQVVTVLDQLPDLQRVVLHGIGEAFLHPQLPEIISLVKSRGPHVVFNSNGTLMRPERIEPIIAAGLDELRISVDSAERETYSLIRGANLLDKIFRNIRSVTAVKQRLAVKHPRLSLWMTALRSNVRELPMLVERAHELGITEVYLQRLVLSERGMARRAESTLGDASLSEVVAAAQQRALELGITLRGSGNTTGADVGGTKSVEAPWRGCRRPWTLTYVTANGNVLPCCISVFTNAPYSSLILGNAFEEPVATLWNGERYRAWRSSMIEGEPPEACRRCGTDWSL